MDIDLFTKGEDADHPCIQTENEHPYLGVTISEWGFANCRLMSHLLSSGLLNYEFATKY
jgi:hypothetical protein